MELKASLKILGVTAMLATASMAHATSTDWGTVAPGTSITKSFSGSYVGPFADTYSFKLLTAGDGLLKRSIVLTLDDGGSLRSGFTGLTFNLYSALTNLVVAPSFSNSITKSYDPLSPGSYYFKVSGTGWADEDDPVVPNPVYLGFAKITALAASVPEPQTYAMFLAGLGIVGTVIRRRSRSF